MKKCLIALALLGLCPSPALGGLVFFDDFEGNALLPHWSLPNPSSWQYDVSNSMLNVTGLFVPSHPKSPVNFANMGAPFTQDVGDFQLDARMGWGTSEGVARFELIVRSGASLLAWIGYREHEVGAPPPAIYANAFGSKPVTIPPPPPGMYDFRIARSGGQFHFYFEGVQFASLPDTTGAPINGLSFSFVSPFPGQSGPFHIDRVQVIPAPGMLVIMIPLALRCRRRR